MSESDYITVPLSTEAYEPTAHERQDNSRNDAKDLNQALRLARWFLIIIIVYFAYAFALNILVLYNTKTPEFRIAVTIPMNTEINTIVYTRFEWEQMPVEQSNGADANFAPLVLLQDKKLTGAIKKHKIDFGTENILQILPHEHLPPGEYRGTLIFEQYQDDKYDEPTASYNFPVNFSFSDSWWPSWAVVIILGAIVFFAYIVFLVFGALFFPKAAGRLKVQKVCRVNDYPEAWDATIKPSLLYLLWPPLKCSVAVRAIMNKKKYNKLKLPAFFLFTISGLPPFLCVPPGMAGELRKISLPNGPYTPKYNDFDKGKKIKTLVNMRHRQLIFFKLKNGTLYSLRYSDKKK